MALTIAGLFHRGLRLGAAGNMHAVHEQFLRRHLEKPAASPAELPEALERV